MGVALIVLYVLIVVMFGAVMGYHYRQNKEEVIGGAMSGAKAFWQGYALFNYFVLSLWLYICLPPTHPAILRALEMFLLLVVFRGVIQLIWMFVLRKWVPPLGIGYNLLTFSVLVLVRGLRGNPTLELSHADGMVLAFLCNVAVILLVDTWYAWWFYRVVGKASTGQKAIWYVPENDSRFGNINRITTGINWCFYSFTSGWIMLLTYRYAIS